MASKTGGLLWNYMHATPYQIFQGWYEMNFHALEKNFSTGLQSWTKENATQQDDDSR